jgi:hypothetical protein
LPRKSPLSQTGPTTSYKEEEEEEEEEEGGDAYVMWWYAEYRAGRMSSVIAADTTRNCLPAKK